MCNIQYALTEIYGGYCPPLLSKNSDKVRLTLNENEFYRVNGLADKGWRQEGRRAYFCSFLFWRSWGIKVHYKGLWIDLMGGREKNRENVKKSHVFYLSQLSVASGNSVLLFVFLFTLHEELSAHNLCHMRKGYEKDHWWQRGPQLRKWTSTWPRLPQEEQTTSVALGLYKIICKAQNSPQAQVKRARYGQS